MREDGIRKGCEDEGQGLLSDLDMCEQDKALIVEETNTPTRRGSQFCHNAHERMIKRNPNARTNERSITAVKKSEQMYQP